MAGSVNPGAGGATGASAGGSTSSGHSGGAGQDSNPSGGSAGTAGTGGAAGTSDAGIVTIDSGANDDAIHDDRGIVVGDSNRTTDADGGATTADSGADELPGDIMDTGASDAAAEVGATFCSSVSPMRSLFLCDDFDRGPLGAQWDQTFAMNGSDALNGNSFSMPWAGAFTVSATTNRLAVSRIGKIMDGAAR
jgi:hypothetical protein